MIGSGQLRRVAERLVGDDEQRERMLEWRRQIEAPILRLRTRHTTDLDALARLHGTDKSSHHHDFARVYDLHLASRRTSVRRLLEIGVGGINSWRGYDTTAGGRSLRMWSEYLPAAEIVGVDIHAKEVMGPRIRFEQGDQSDPVFLRGLIERYGSFDVVIDDGSHIGRHLIATFEALWPAVVPGGMYVIEDIQTSYDPQYEGGPPGTHATAAQLIKDSVDSTLRRENDPSFRPAIAAMYVYGEIVFLEKAK